MGLDIVKMREQSEKKAGKENRFELQDGDNNIRILPPSLEYFSSNIPYFGYKYMMHYQLGVEGSKTAEVCPKTWETVTTKIRCPICEVAAKLWATKDPEDEKLARKISKKTRYLFNVVDLNNKDKGIQIMEAGIQVHTDLKGFIENPKWGDILDLDTGRDVVITKVSAKQSQSGYASYSAAPDPSVSSARGYLPKNFKEAIELLKNEVPKAKSYEELKITLEGGEGAVDVGAVRAAAAVEKHPADQEEPMRRHQKLPVPVAEVKHEEPLKTHQKLPVVESVESTSDEGGETPECFGELYGPRRPECVPCTFKASCRDKFLNM